MEVAVIEFFIAKSVTCSTEGLADIDTVLSNTEYEIKSVSLKIQDLPENVVILVRLISLNLDSFARAATISRMF